MDIKNRFKIVFEKVIQGKESADFQISDVEASAEEIDGIKELGRLSQEIAQPLPKSYTTT